MAILSAFALSRPLRQRVTANWRDLLPLLGVVVATVLHLVAGAPRPESTRFVALVTVGAACFAYFRAVDEESQRLGLRLMTLSASVLGIYAVAQALGFDFFHYPSESWMYRVVTTLGHRNFTAVFLLVSLFVALDLRETCVQRTSGSAAMERWATIALMPTYLGLLATGARFPILMPAWVGIAGSGSSSPCCSHRRDGSGRGARTLAGSHHVARGDCERPHPNGDVRNQSRPVPGRRRAGARKAVPRTGSRIVSHRIPDGLAGRRGGRSRTSSSCMRIICRRSS